MNCISEVIVNGYPEMRLFNTINLCLKYREEAGVLINLDFEAICASSRSACTSASLEPLHVLLAMGLSSQLAHRSLRLTLNKFATEEDVDKVLGSLLKIAARVRDMSPSGGRRGRNMITRQKRRLRDILRDNNLT